MAPQLIALPGAGDELSGWLRNGAPGSHRQADSLMLGSGRRAPRPPERREPDSSRVKCEGGVEGPSREVGRWGIPEKVSAALCCVSWRLHDLQLWPGSVSSKVCGLVFEILINFFW